MHFIFTATARVMFRVIGDIFNTQIRPAIDDIFYVHTIKSDPLSYSIYLLQLRIRYQAFSNSLVVRKTE